jgi:hypothetical protein
MKKTGQYRLLLSYPSKKIFAAFLFFGFLQARGFPLPAEEPPAYFPEAGRSIQRLRWNDIDFAAWYEVTVETGEPVSGGGAAKPADDSGLVWRGLMREKRELPYIDCSLVPGQYRYRVRAFDILGREGEISEWASFEVRPAPGGGPVQRLSWTGAEFAAACMVVVERQAEETAGDRGAYREVLRELRGRDAFIEVSLPPGKYRFQVGAYDVLGRPGEISGWEYFEILAAATAPEKPVPEQPETPESEEPAPERPETPENAETKVFWDGFVEALYTPLIPLPFSYFNETYDVLFQPAGAALKFGALFPVGRRQALGFDLSPSWNYLYAKKIGCDVLAHLLTLHLNLVYSRGFSALPLTLHARAGGGFSLLYDFHFEHPEQPSGESVNTWIPSASAGLSLQWFFRRPFYLSLGVEYLQIFSVDNLFLNFIRPSAGLGVVF